MKHPRKFFKPLAIGAPEPLRELPVRLERMVHFVPPHIEKMRAKVPELIAEVDVILGNLEDAVPADAKQAARKGFIDMARASEFGTTWLTCRPSVDTTAPALVLRTTAGSNSTTISPPALTAVGPPAGASVTIVVPGVRPGRTELTTAP